MADEERRPMDPTRRMLRVFGVTVTNYEERMGRLLERAAAAEPGQAPDLLGLALEAVDLTADLTERLRAMNDHVLATQTRLLGELRATLEKGRG